MLMSAESIQKFYGGAQILRNASFTLNPGEKLALVGRNGAGKTTILRILSGQEAPDDGRVTIQRSTRMAYLSQQREPEPHLTMWNYLLGAFAGLQQLWERMKRLEAEMSFPELQEDPDRLGQVLDAYAKATDAYERGGGYEYEARVKETAFGLGFREDDLSKELSTLSGGQLVRASLARLLLNQPDILMLDEPTNHLDLASVEWLEGHLKGLKAAVIVISHDRFFLDAVADRVAELDEGIVTVYNGNYSHYVRQRAERIARQLDEFGRQQEEMTKLQDYIARYKAGNRATMAKSREKRLAKIESIRAPQREMLAMSLSFTGTKRSGREVLQISSLQKGFGSAPLFDGLNLLIERGDRLGVIGPNGCGKSTLLRILTGCETPDQGDVRYGEGVQSGFLSQGVDDLDEQSSVMDEILSTKDLLVGEARSFLARFLFRGEDVFKPVSALSGGERTRLAFAKLLLQGPNLLILDEPTNHLDLASREALEAALSDFDGTLLAVSHDRRFLERIATRMLAFESASFPLPVPGFTVSVTQSSPAPTWCVVDFPGSFAEYRTWLSAARAHRAETEQKGGQSTGPKLHGQSQGPKQSLGGRQGSAKPKVPPEAIEAEIGTLETEKRRLEKVLADPESYKDVDEAHLVTEQYQQLTERLEALYHRWEEALAAFDSA